MFSNKKVTNIEKLRFHRIAVLTFKIIRKLNSQKSTKKIFNPPKHIKKNRMSIPKQSAFLTYNKIEILILPS